MPDQKPVQQKPMTVKELGELINSYLPRADGPASELPSLEEGYQQAADAMWKAAVAAFDFTARAVGATGFQASWAALKAYQEIMNIEAPFMVVTLDERLYRDEDLANKVRTWSNSQEARIWLAEQAEKKIEEYKTSDMQPHPAVMAHWWTLIADKPKLYNTEGTMPVNTEEN